MEDFDGVFDIIDLIHKTMLNVDAAGISSRQVANKFLVGRRILEWILGDDVEKPLGLGFEIRGRNLLGVLLGLLGVND